MLSRYWRPTIALGFGLAGIVLAVLAVVALIAYGEMIGCKKPYANPRHATPNQNLPPYSSAPGVKQALPQSVQKELRCDNPGSEKEYELCQPWRQAEAADDAACIARWQFYAGLVGIGLIFVTFLANAVAGLGTIRSAEVARDTLIASQRAWIRRDQIVFASPLSFRQNGWVHSSIQLRFTNVGNAPALHINERAWLLGVTDGTVPEDRATALFKEARQHPVSGGFALFPKQRYPRRVAMWVQQGLDLNREDADAATDGFGRMSLYVAVCINYSFASDLSKNHQTSCLFEVHRTSGLFIERIAGTDIPETELRLDDSGFLSMDVAD